MTQWLVVHCLTLIFIGLMGAALYLLVRDLPPVNVIRVRGWMKYQHDGPGQRHPDEEGEQASVELWNGHHRSLGIRRVLHGAYAGADCQVLLGLVGSAPVKTGGLAFRPRTAERCGHTACPAAVRSPVGTTPSQARSAHDHPETLRRAGHGKPPKGDCRCWQDSTVEQPAELRNPASLPPEAGLVPPVS